MKDKRITMAQWTNLNRKNSFVNPQRLILLCGISGAVHLVLVSLTAGWLAGWQMKSKIICIIIFYYFIVIHPVRWGITIIHPYGFFDPLI